MTETPHSSSPTASSDSTGVPLWHDRTVMRPTWTLEELMAAKGEQCFSVVIPTLNEGAHIGAVVGSIVPYVGGLVDEIIVIDSASTDDTVEQACSAGATVRQLAEILPEVPVRLGKGESLWRGIAACGGDIVVFIDGDLKRPDPRYVPWLVAPLLLDGAAPPTGDATAYASGGIPRIDMVKGFYRRPLGDTRDGGGRVTELVARPLLASLCPEARFLIQPLGGEYALRRHVAERLPFAAGYGVEIGLIMDVVALWGADHICQVNLGVREHRNRPLHQLGRMSREVADTVLRKAGMMPEDAPLVQFAAARHDSTSYTTYHPVEIAALEEDRPPLVTVPSYVAARQSVASGERVQRRRLWA